MSNEWERAGNLSVKDIKAAGQFERLIQPVGEYVAFIRQQNVKAVHPYIHINTTDTLGKAFRRFAATVLLTKALSTWLLPQCSLCINTIMLLHRVST